MICSPLRHLKKCSKFLKKRKKLLTRTHSDSILVEWVEETKPNGILAQLGEHLPYKQRVIGSSPIGPIFLV